jgi:APA family basic amino acid/polyamine antiporter
MNRKALSLPLLISLVIGNMIGNGIYILPASLAVFGTISLLAWIYTSTGAMLLALTFANLSKRFPKTGGPYVYCKLAFGKLTGFIVAYIYWISNLVSIAALSVASVGYLGFISPTLNSNSPNYNHFATLLFEISFVWIFTMINLIGVHTAGVVQLLLTIIKLSPLILITIIGFSHIHLDNLMHLTVGETSHFSAFSSAAAITFWAFIGLESATVPAENTQGYRDIFKATVYGTLIAAVIYVASTFVIMGMLPIQELMRSQFPFAEAASQLFGTNMAVALAVCAVISGLGALNGCILIQGQIVFAAARDSLFPHYFAKLSKHDVPVAGQIFSCVIITLYLILTIKPVLLKQFNQIALFASLLTLIVYFVSMLAEIKFTLQSKGRLWRLLLSKSLVVATIAAAYACWMISSFDRSLLLSALILFIVAVPIYIFIIRKQTDPLI